MPKTSQFLKLGVTVGLGTDGPASNNSLDMFETMKIAALFQKASYLDPTLLPAESVLRMATINGARALGLEKQIGSLEVGKRGDIVLIDFDKPHLTPKYDLYTNIVYSARGSDVDSVIVDGNILMEKRKIRTLKEEEVMEKAQRTASNLKIHYEKFLGNNAASKKACFSSMSLFRKNRSFSSKDVNFSYYFSKQSQNQP